MFFLFSSHEFCRSLGRTFVLSYVSFLVPAIHNSVIVNDLDFVRVSVSEFKTKPILIVNSNAVLSLALAFQRFQAISRGSSQVAKLARVFKLEQLALGDSEEIDGKTPALSRHIKLLRLRISEALNHHSNITLDIIKVKHYRYQRQPW